MPSLTYFKICFTPSWLMTALAVLFISLFIHLGFWQLHRADEKKQMVSAEMEQSMRTPDHWDPKQKLPKQYQRLILKGHYLTQVFLLDNQHQKHQFGYDVLNPLLLTNGVVVMIDRGWILGDGMRRAFPDIKIPLGMLELQGMVYFPSQNQWILGPSMEEKENKITILERLDINLVSSLLQKKVYPFIIRLDKKEANGFVREWATVSMPAQRHLGYAVQWFAMALVIFILFITLNLKKI